MVFVRFPLKFEVVSGRFFFHDGVWSASVIMFERNASAKVLIYKISLKFDILKKFFFFLRRWLLQPQTNNVLDVKISFQAKRLLWVDEGGLN